LFSLCEIFRLKYWLILYLTFGLYTVASDYSNEFAGYLVAMGIQFGTGFKLADIVLFVIVWSFFTYWNHRIQHLHPFWNLHRLHHTATELTLFTSQRNNPMMLLVDSFFRIWPFIFLLPDSSIF
jgi:sterol desaturase/sphingolipid hydroxylase (fatty acid hydroxylase superfamily)